MPPFSVFCGEEAFITSTEIFRRNVGQKLESTNGIEIIKNNWVTISEPVSPEKQWIHYPGTALNKDFHVSGEARLQSSFVLHLAKKL